MSDATYMITRAILTIVAALISIYVIPYIDSLTENERQKSLFEAVKASVMAAEQVIRGSGKGIEKKEAVIKDITEWMNDHGIVITFEQVETLIEAAVFEMNRGQSS